MDRVLPTPTPHDIEAALCAMRNRTNAYGQWARLDQHMVNYHQVLAETDRLCWVDIINPEGVEETACGGGITPAEAAAVAWINTCVCAWWLHPDFSDADDAKVLRQVPDGWRFELYASPVRLADGQ
jgi:hypothetical protein